MFSTIFGFLSGCCGLNTGLCDCTASSLSTELSLQPVLQCSLSLTALLYTHAVLLIARFRLKSSFPTTSFRCLFRDFHISVPLILPKRARKGELICSSSLIALYFVCAMQNDSCHKIAYVRCVLAG